MMSNNEPKLFRLIDANINRLKEGIRVAEDIERYIFDNKALAGRLKNLRHKATYEDERMLMYRDIRGDVLRDSIKSELQREDIQNILKANLKRAQESARVLEEAMKLVDLKWSETFKAIRYELYDIEKEI